MSITTTGYSIKRYVDIIAEIRQELITASGNPNLDLSDDSILGIINNIYALKLSELHELAQAQWSAGDPDTATGIALDRIVARARMSRLPALKAYGTLHFTDSTGKTLNSGTQVKDLAGNIVQTTAQLTLNTANNVATLVNVTVVNSTTYSVTINNVVYNFVSDASATVTEIISGLISSLSVNTNLVCTDAGGVLSIKSGNPYNISVGANLSISKVTKGVSAEALVASDEVFESTTLSYGVTPLGTTTVTNLQDFVTGRLQETDEQLRSRFKQSVGGQGSATVDAIYARLSETLGVTSVSVEDNWTNSTNVNGLPPKSFECTVKGGSDDNVAAAIWKSKPAGIQTYGNMSKTITDTQGVQQTINFSRPVDKYIHVSVTYSLYNEEVFPANGVDMIKNAVLQYGNGLSVGNDVIVQRIMAAIYNKVDGIGNLNVLIGATPLPSDSPLLSTNTIVIGRKEESLFDLSRITVTT